MGGIGFTRYHHAGLVVPLLVFLSLAAWSLLPFQLAQPLVALMAGACMAVAAYLVFRFVPGFKEVTAPFGKAVVLGAIVAEILTFHAYHHVPPASSICLAMFLYLYAAETADGLHK